MKGLVRVGIAAAFVVGLFSFGAGPTLASAATSAVLVKDINPGAATSYPYGAVNLNGTVLFSADDGVHGRELWKSDGTAAGTVLVRDINPGPDASNPSDPVELNGTVFFGADDGTRGRELWKSDGTAAGTSLVADIDPGPASSSPQALVNFKGALFFSADDGVRGREPWRSDGTSTGTRLVRDVVPGAGIYNDGFEKALAVGDTLFFIAADYDRDSEQLWRTDGTAGGTVFVTRTYCADCDRATYFQASLNGLAILTVHAGCCGARVLLRSDGTPEGTYVFDSVIGGSGTIFNGAYYYFDPALEVGEGTTELRRSDGTIEGTTLVKDLLPGMGPGTSELTVVEDRLLFLAYTWRYPPGDYVLSLWSSDGTAGGTSRLFDIGTLDFVNRSPGSPGPTTRVGDSLFFEVATGGSGYELWKTDGTAAGTYLVRDINVGEGGSYPLDLTVINGTLFFSADDGVHGRELWKTTPPLRSAYKNASRYCKAPRASSADGYKNHGQCVSGNH